MSEEREKIGGEVERKKVEHPLMNPLILESVFKNLGVRDLKVARQVSTLWRDCSQEEWYKSVKLRIDKGPKRWSPHGFAKYKHKRFLQVVGGEKGGPTTPLELQLRENWTALCDKIQTLELVHVTLPTVNSLRNALFICFPSLEHLILGSVIVHEVEDLSSSDSESSEPTSELPRQPQFESTRRNLKTLTVSVMANHKDLPISWMEVLEHFPALETLDLTHCSKTHPIFEAVNEIRAVDPSKLNLKHLRLYSGLTSLGNISSATLLTLKDARLHLETIASLRLCDAGDVLHFRDILQLHAGTLKTLDFSIFPDVQFALDPPIPELKNVQEVEIKLSPYSLEALAFLQFTPKLKKLTLFALDPDGQEVPHFNLSRFPVMLSSCEELGFFDFGRNLSLESMKSLVEWMPKLKILKISCLDNATFALICEKWTNLVKLHVQCSDVTSSGILGWDEEDVNRFGTMMKYKRPAAPPLWKPITLPKPNITNLKKLQILTMTVTGYHPTPPVLSAEPLVFMESRSCLIYDIFVLTDIGFCRRTVITGGKCTSATLFQLRCSRSDGVDDNGTPLIDLLQISN